MPFRRNRLSLLLECVLEVTCAALHAVLHVLGALRQRRPSVLHPAIELHLRIVGDLADSLLDLPTRLVGLVLDLVLEAHGSSSLRRCVALLKVTAGDPVARLDVL